MNIKNKATEFLTSIELLCKIEKEKLKEQFDENKK